MTVTTRRVANYETASRYIEEMKDLEAQAFVKYGVTTVLLGRRIPESALPTAPFDLGFLCLVLEAMYANKAAIEMIMRGQATDLGFDG